MFRLLKRPYVLWGAFLVLVAIILSVGTFCFSTNGSVRYVNGQSPPAGPIECRLVLNDRSTCLASAYHALPPGSLRNGRIPPVNNPLVMRDLLARVEVRNKSCDEFTVFSRRGQPEAGMLTDAAGTVMAEIYDEEGRPVESNPVLNSLKVLGSADVHTGEWLWDETLTAPQRPVIQIPPSEVLVYKFSALPGKVPPGAYIVRAVFRYHEAPSGALQWVRSNPLAIHITQRDLDEWEKSWDVWINLP